MTTIQDIEKELCEKHVPTKFNLYKWARENPDTAIAHALKRTEKIFDESDEVMFGFSGGKDSSLTTQIAILELKRRWARVEAGVDRDGNQGVDPLDQKWVGKKLWGNSMDAEWVYTDAITHIEEFCQKHGPGVYEYLGKRFSGNHLHRLKTGEMLTSREIYSKVSDGETVSTVKFDLNKGNFKQVIEGDNTVNMFYKCLRLGWQSGVSFSESRLTSWDLEKKDMWIRPMPLKENLGFDVITNENIHECNMVRLDSLPENWQEIRLRNEDYVEVHGVKLVANFGLGSHDLKLKGYEAVDFSAWTFDYQDEDQEQESFSTWLLESFPDATSITNLIALRAAESFDRYTILRQSDYSTGQYAHSKL